MDVPHWFALYVRSRFEKRVDEQLSRAGVESFLPLVEETHVWSDRRKRVLAPLFPGYVFVRTDLKDRVAILQTDGVVRFVSIGNQVSRVPDNQIEWVKILIGQPDKIHRAEYVSVGERVRVIAGVFRGMEGTISQVKGSTRVVISLDTIAQAVSIDVGPDFLERL